MSSSSEKPEPSSSSSFPLFQSPSSALPSATTPPSSSALGNARNNRHKPHKHNDSSSVNNNYALEDDDDGEQQKSPHEDQSGHKHENDDNNNNHKASGSLFSHLTYPISYTTSALLRRLSEDSAPTPLARALSANYNGSMFEMRSSSSTTATTSSLFNPPHRTHSPFQPPPLTPLTLSGYKESTGARGRLLSRALAEEIRLLVPSRLQLVDEWELRYSLEQNGSSLKSLYSATGELRGKRGGFVVVVRDGGGGIFGVYLSDAPYPQAHYYGTGESFLWRASRLPNLPDLSSLPPPPSADTTNMTRSTTIGAHLSRNSSSASFASLSKHPDNTKSSSSSTGGGGAGSNSTGNTEGTNTPERIRFKAFPYTGENDFVLLCQQGFLSVGGGDGRYGLWLDDTLARGISSPCPTFMNEKLSDEGEKFGVLGVEVWYLGA
ncbi:hypothetical protein AAFC00_000289 [Neodothiora populina]|uniref:Oxidation resistance protein 1 n=1 Tax=Neodothiora populina TaxID=2781224 RepID=A0ABR3PDL8_9PEZI